MGNLEEGTLQCGRLSISSLSPSRAVSMAVPGMLHASKSSSLLASRSSLSLVGLFHVQPCNLGSEVIPLEKLPPTVTEAQEINS